MEQLIRNASNAIYHTCYEPDGLGIDPHDRVTAAYPPLATYGFYALQWAHQGRDVPARRPRLNPADFCSCAESAIMLAMAKVWEDDVLKHGREKAGPLRSLEVSVARGGATVNQMIRILQRLRLDHFPIAMYQVEGDRFVLQHGKLRDDNYAIVFVPQDQAGGMQWAHWTFGTVVIEDPPAVVAATERTVVYTKYNVTDPQVFWRAAVCPENLVCYEAARAAGLACDCDWNAICTHEMEFMCGMRYSQLRDNGIKIGELWRRIAGVVRRVTLDGETHILGTYRGILEKSVVGGYGVRRVGASGVMQRTPAGTVVERQGMDPSLPMKANRPWYDVNKYVCNNEFMRVRKVPGMCALQPMALSLWEIEDDYLLQSWKGRHLPSVTLPRLVYTLKGWIKNTIVGLDFETPRRAWAADEDLNLRLPRKAELLNRLALRQELTSDNVLDVVRRMCAEEKWDVDIDAEEFKIWLGRVVTQVGKTAQIPAPTTGQCWTCLQRVKTYRHLCRQCKLRMRESPPWPVPQSDSLVVYVGLRPLWSKVFKLPEFELKSDVKILLAKSRRVLLDASKLSAKSNMDECLARFYREAGAVSARGMLCGPMFLGQEPTCFPRGEAVAMLAFMVRLGAKREHEALEWVYDVGFQLLRPWLTTIDPESWDEFISHFSGLKKLKNEEGHREETHGWLPQPRGGELLVQMTGFPKAEKSYNVSYDPDRILMEKPTEKPRFICSPSPAVLAKLGRWTHAQTKWLARTFTCRDHLYYAGCSTPEELNTWLNLTLTETTEPYTLVDDITAIDANHSRASFEFHARVRRVQFPYAGRWIQLAYKGEETLKIRVGKYLVEVNDVNASGVSDTSYKNSLICLIVRALALLHSLMDISEWEDSQVVEAVMEMLKYVWITASGDDGLIRLPAVVLGVPVLELSMERYRQLWSWAGFGVKAVMLPPNKWRMATFLAMRPVWSGARYEWAPEPARRLRGLFWQIDCPIHHEAWGRGVATQVLAQSRALPVLSDICQWYLDNTRGPISAARVGNEHSPFFGSVMSAGVSDRSLDEFCLDYHVTRSDYEVFKRMLASSKAVQVCFSCFLLERVFQEES